jgi:hypothetical protein
MVTSSQRIALPTATIAREFKPLHVLLLAGFRSRTSGQILRVCLEVQDPADKNGPAMVR